MMFKVYTLVALMAVVPVLSYAKPITSLTIHSEDNRKYCNDGFSWDETDKMCLPDNGN